MIIDKILNNLYGKSKLVHAYKYASYFFFPFKAISAAALTGSETGES